MFMMLWIDARLPVRGTKLFIDVSNTATPTASRWCRIRYVEARRQHLAVLELGQLRPIRPTHRAAVRHRFAAIEQDVRDVVGLLLVLLEVVAIGPPSTFQSRWRMSSPGTYSRCCVNSIANPRNGDLCSPAMYPSTTMPGLQPEGSARLIAAGRGGRHAWIRWAGFRIQDVSASRRIGCVGRSPDATPEPETLDLRPSA